MPRLSQTSYLARCRHLRQLWFKHPRLLATLTPLEQWQLHDYYRFAEPLTDLERLRHRGQVSSEQPSLPAQAGWAFAHLSSHSAAVSEKTEPIQVYSLVNPHPDAADLAQLLVEIATQAPRVRPTDPRRGDIEDRAA